MSDSFGGPTRCCRFVVVISLAAAFSIFGLACGGDGGAGLPAPGGINVTVVTSGPEPDPDGYALILDGGASVPMGINASHYYDEIEPGQHTVQLDGLAANCSVAGENARTVTVAAGEEVTVEFQVTCSATSGSLRVTTTTSGPAPDPDGYTVTLDGTEAVAISVNGTATLTTLTPGAHLVGLSGLAANCAIEGENPTAVTIVASQEAAVSFAVTCVHPPPGTGTLRVITATTGADLDPDGYRIRMDDGTGQAIGTTDTLTLSNLPAGAHSVRLVNIAANCTLAGENPRAVTVTAGATTLVNLAVTCAATTGSLTITTTTTGSGTDPDGYSVSVDAQAGQSIGINDTVTVPNLAVGLHSVGLADVAAGCLVQGNNPRTLNTEAGVSTTILFSITCSPPGLSQWKSMPIATTNTLISISGTSPRNIFVVDTAGAIWHYDGAAWTAQPVPAKASQVWTSVASSAFATGKTSEGMPVMLRFDGQQWLVAFSPDIQSGLEHRVFSWNEIWGIGTDVFAMGYWHDEFYSGPYQGYLAHYDGAGWSSELCCGEPELVPVGIWGSSANDLYIIANFLYYDGTGFVLHRSGAGWSEVLQLYGYVVNIWGSSASDIYVTRASDYRVDPSLWHFDGVKWDEHSSPRNWPTGPIWGSAPDDIYLLGRTSIYHFDGGRWKTLYTREMTESGFTGIWGSSSSDVFVIGEKGIILHGSP